MALWRTQIDLSVGGTWTDITGYVLNRAPIEIIRGAQDEGAGPEPGRCRMTLNNRDGRFSPRNPAGPWYGLIGRNTPIRVSVHAGPAFLELDGAGTSRAVTPGAAALDITGDLDLRIDAALDNWLPTGGISGSTEIVGRDTFSSPERSWLLLTRNRRPHFEWSPTGTGTVQVDATADLPVRPGYRLALRVTLDVDNGAGWTVRFYTAPTLAGPWTPLGAPVNGGTGPTSIHPSAAPLAIGNASSELAYHPAQGRVYGLEVRAGIDGPPVAAADFSAVPPGSSSFTDSAGRAWTLEGAAAVTNRRVRFVGEVSAWPPRWDRSGQDVYVPVEAAGILRRLGQRDKQVQSVLRRETAAPGQPPAAAYWPCEDATGSTSLASAIGGPPMTITGRPELAASEAFAASAPLPVLANGSALTGTVPTYSTTGQTQCRFLLAVPAAGVGDGQCLLRLSTTGSAARWDLIYGAGGTLSLQAYDREGVALTTNPSLTAAINGKLLRISVELTQVGTSIKHTVVGLEVGADLGFFTDYTLAGRTVGRVTRVSVAPSRGVADTTIGHVTLHNTITSIFDLADELTGWAGEAAGRRVERLCAEQEIPFQSADDLAGTHAMGPQRVGSILPLLQDAADVDHGVLHETRDAVGLTYRTSTGTYNQRAVLELDFDAPGDITEPPDPVDDDQQTVNDVSVSRTGGSSARAVLEEGVLSVQPPPDGVGRYDTAVTLNLAADDQLPAHAGWLLHLGTWDEARWPRLPVALHAAPGRIDAACSVDLRDRITVADPPPWLAPGLINLLVEGYTETITLDTWTLAYVCAPAGPWTVAVVGDPVRARVDAVGSTLSAAAGPDNTALSVTPGAAAWSATDTPYDVAVGGEVMTVTSVTGTSPQTLTVTRAVNSIRKAHPAGSSVRIAAPAVIAL